jgi:hypothetical protein
MPSVPRDCACRPRRACCSVLQCVAGAAGSRRRRVNTISTAREQYLPATIPRPDGDGHNAKPLPEPIYFAVDDLESIYDKCRDSGASFSSAVVPGARVPSAGSRRELGENDRPCGRSVRQFVVLR